jgi:hypothetical protein
MPQYGIGEPNAVESIFSNTPENVSGYNSLDQRAAVMNAANAGDTSGKYLTEFSQVPISEVRSHVFYAENIISELINEIDSNLEQVNINSYCNIELETAHKAVWKDITKNSEIAKNLDIPNYIPYKEYIYASQHLCRACRDLVKNYDLSISHTTFGHLIDIKKILLYIKNEIVIIRNIVTHHLGEEYKDETESQIAKHLSDWAKTATHYTKQLAKEITNPAATIPQTEVEKITEKHAAQFQSFFALKVNSYISEIQTISNLIKRDSVDIAQTFYSSYLLPAMSFKSSVIEPLVFDFTTSAISRDCPTLAGEIVMANNAVTGNLGSVTTDYIERRIQFSSRMDGILQSISLKRRYVNYIVQLESIAIQRVKILSQTTDENIEVYKDLFDSMPVDSEKRNSLRSSHAQLDDLDGDAHPQYLRRDGGIITGNIQLAEGATIGGMPLATHSHSGIDGSAPISAKSIDYASGREEYYSSLGENGYSNIALTGLEQSTLVGGGLYFDATFEIEIDDDKINSYEFEILYNEI